MIVIDKDGQVTDWLKSLDMNSTGITRIDLVTFELANGFESEFVVVEDTIYRQMGPLLRDKLDQVEGVILFRTGAEIIDSYIPSIVGEISQKSPLTLIENIFMYFEDHIKDKAVLKSQMISLNKELIDVMSGVDEQVERVKRVYETKAPKRLENYKGVFATSKYAAGESSGGEYFDLYTHENKIFIIMSYCSSFLASSSLLELLSEMKSKKIIEQSIEKDFINKFNNEVKLINETREKPINVSLFTGIIDTSTLMFQGHQFGEFQFLSSNLSSSINTKNSDLTKSEESFFQLQLERGQRVMINSPGFVKNWNHAQAEFLLEELILNTKNKSLDILDEAFFSMKKKSLNGFLTYDASSLILEVNNNVMLKV